MTQTPTLAQLLKQAIDNRLMEAHTALIAVVESYDAAKQQVNVSPVLKRRMKTLEGEWISEQLPVLCDVPVLFPRAGGFFISFPIATIKTPTKGWSRAVIKCTYEIGRLDETDKDIKPHQIASLSFSDISIKDEVEVAE